jgi:hypothetical protein
MDAHVTMRMCVRVQGAYRMPCPGGLPLLPLPLGLWPLSGLGHALVWFVCEVGSRGPPWERHRRRVLGLGLRYVQASLHRVCSRVCR